MKGINVEVKPSGTGCVECLKNGTWWFHLRRCAECGHIGCCDTSPERHATQHFHQTGHPIIQSFEPDEDWFWDFTKGSAVNGPLLASPHNHPLAQSVPGPEGAVPSDWMDLLNQD
ncbi:UBP-type zinc finger domain-containing protein [Granulicella cerasi]|uniref:UBP-type zinc finger domain-containing protein n=1 Tax=Granulicella cerasi TaxID=741063 RepID=A0ABW1Z6R9_9BACT|nr:UBP-type zinc finger domain-containing protein [Granulicella cerasi]